MDNPATSGSRSSTQTLEISRKSVENKPKSSKQGKASSKRKYELEYNEQRRLKRSIYGRDVRNEKYQLAGPVNEGDDFRCVPQGNGAYSFHTLYEHNDINLAQRYVQRVQEQLDDPTFLMEWKVYEKWNARAKEVYRLRIESDIPRKLCEQEEAA